MNRLAGSLAAAMVLVMAVCAASLLAQATAPGGGQNPGQSQPRGNRGNFQQQRQQFQERLKQALGSSDDEWNVLDPKIQKVQGLQRASSTRGGMFRGGRRGGGGNSADASPSPVQQALQSLQQTLGNKDAPQQEIQAKLTALRQARAAARADLAKAQDELRDVLTPRQEAVLVEFGILE